MSAARHDGWTDQELHELYEVVNALDWFDEVAPFIDRSENAIRQKMSALRREAGIVPQQCGPRAKARSATAWDDAAIGSDRLRRAVERMEAA